MVCGTELSGVSSFVSKKCERDYELNMFTTVSHHYSWINEITGNTLPRRTRKNHASTTLIADFALFATMFVFSIK